MTSLKTQLQQRFRSSNIWRQNLVYRDQEDDLDRMSDLSFERNEISISDWGFEKILKQPLIKPATEPQTEVTKDHIADQYRDDITGDINWDRMRDVLHDEQYATDYDTKIKAGNAVGCIRRFLFEAKENDTVLVNSSSGTAIAVFDGPAVYDPDKPQTDIDPNHVFSRPIRFMHGENGDIITYDSSELPPPLKPNKMTMTRVNRDDLRTLLKQAEALSSLADTMTLVES